MRKARVFPAALVFALTVLLASTDVAAASAAPPGGGVPAGVSVDTIAAANTAAAKPGATVRLAPVVFRGPLRVTADRVTVVGPRGAVIDGGAVKGSVYTVHLDNVRGVTLDGFTVRGGAKGVMADQTRGSVIRGLLVERTGQEAIHVRNDSTRNLIVGNLVRDTGLDPAKREQSEGIYLGTWWKNDRKPYDRAPGRPDETDGNVVRGNVITRTGGEAIDVQTAASGNLIVGNRMTGGTAGGVTVEGCVSVKGDANRIVGNVCTGAARPGAEFKVVAVKGSGSRNVFSGNRGGVELESDAVGNVVL